MKRTYAATKICLIVHAYMNISAGETHRLSEVSHFGCIPVVETWGDTQPFLDHYEECGDVIFASTDTIVNVTQQVLAEIDNDDDDVSSNNNNKQALLLNKRLKWWGDGIHWKTVLPTAFGLNATN